MSDLHSAIERGHYASQQLFSRATLVAWSHRRRFSMALHLARDFRGKRLLDYGCGDGTFLAMAMMSGRRPATGIGAELRPHTVEDCRQRYRAEPRLKFALVNELDDPVHRGAYDAVFCMEVLEHVVDWDPVLGRLGRLLAPEGRLIISVPVETGLPLVVKQSVRRIAGWQKVGHYPGTTSYSPSEMVRAILAHGRQHVERPVFDVGSGPFHDHKGFNWMLL